MRFDQGHPRQLALRQKYSLLVDHHPKPVLQRTAGIHLRFGNCDSSRRLNRVDKEAAQPHNNRARVFGYSAEVCAYGCDTDEFTDMNNVQCLSRRQLIKLGGFAAVSCFGKELLAPGVQLYTVRDQVMKQPLATLREIADDWLSRGGDVAQPGQDARAAAENRKSQTRQPAL